MTTRIAAAIGRSLIFLVSVVAAALTHLSALAQCPTNVPHITGTWSVLPYQMPINPISTNLLPNGRVLIVAGSENDARNNSRGAESYRAAVWDPSGTDESSISVQNLTYDVFCSGTAALFDGRSLIVGGTSDYSFTGENRASIFNPATNQYVQSQNMVDGRWYATATALADGRIMAMSGLTQTGGTSQTIEIYDLQRAGAGWNPPTSVPFSPPLYPRLELLPGGRVFYTGHGSGTSNANAWIFDPATGGWTQSATTNVNRKYGSSVLLPLLPPGYLPRVMNFGGGANPAKSSTDIIDLSVPTPSYTAGPNMSTGRIQMNAVILPNGKILAEGGSVNNEAPNTPGKTADLYDPVSNTMGSAGTAAYSRLYHSTALLLPDASVVSSGSNPGKRGRYEAAIEIYTPSYLYDANDHLITTDRPQITALSFSGPIHYGTPFSVSYASTSPISSAVLIRLGSSTHASDMEQRLIGLCGVTSPCTASGNTLSLTTPPDGSIAPPGYYMLFLLDSAGVPSKARFIQLTPNSYSLAPPTGAITTPSGDMTITAGSAINFGTTTSASSYSWVFPGGTPATSTAQNPGNVTFSTYGMYTVSLTVIDATGNSDPNPPTRTICVLPTSPDFDITVSPAAQEVVPGGSTTYTVTVTPESGFTGTVNLSVVSESGFPTGITSGGFSPASITAGGSSTLTMQTSTSTTPYALSLTITGTSGTITHTASTTLLVNLAPPESLTATAGDAQVSLSWPASVGASGYHVKRAMVDGGPYETFACPSGTSVVDTGLVNGTTYYYTVSAAYTGGPDAGGESANSVQVSATPQGGTPTPTPPPTPTATPNDTPTPTPTATATATPTATATATATATPTATPTASPTPGNACYRQMTVNHAFVSSTQSNFTVLVSVTDATLRTISNGGHVANSNGYDIGFYTDSSGSTKLKWEIESYNPVTGQLIAWVKIPTLSSTSDTSFYLFYGDPSITSDQSDPVNTWDSNFKAVYHLGNGITLTASDSTGGNNGTLFHSPTAVAGEIDGGAHFVSASTQTINLGTPGDFPITTAWSAEAWVNPVAAGAMTVVGWGQTANNGPRIGANGTGSTWRLSFYGGANTDGGSVSAGSWQHVVGTFDGSSLRLYKNGSLVAGPKSASPTTSANPGGWIGSFNSTQFFNGDIDEIRISNTNRGADWIQTEYNNQNSPGTFITMGSESCPSGTPTPTPTATPSTTPTPTPTSTATPTPSATPTATPTPTPPPPTPTPTATATATPTATATATATATPTATPTASPTPGNACQRQMTVNYTLVPSTQSNFTVLVSVTDATLRTISNGGHVANSNGYDIGFYTDSSGSTKLKWEIESYNPLTGQLIAWVNIPTLSSTSDTSFYLFYGDPSITSDQSDPVNTWDANFKAVYHLGNGITLTARDSTGGNNGTLSHSPTAVTGEIDGGAHFVSASTQTINLGTPGDFPITTAWSAEAWVNPVAAGAMTVVGWGQTANNGPRIGANGTGSTWRLSFYGGANTDGGSVSAGSWQHVVGTFDGSSLRLYKNGSLVAGPKSASPTTSANPGGWIGSFNGTQFFNGDIDEIRISNTNRGADWIQTEYNNQNSPATFITLGSESCP